MDALALETRHEGSTPEALTEVPDDAAWQGIANLLDHYIGLEPDDRVTICYTPDARLAAAWVKLALSYRNVEAKTLVMAPLVDPGFKDRLVQLVPTPPNNDIREILILFEAITMSHNEEIRDVLRNHDPAQYRVVRAINSGYDLFATGLKMLPGELSALNAAILERGQAASGLRIETSAGTDLRVELDNSRYRWISNRGIPAPGKFLVLPCGEVATYPAAISGRLVADFALNVNTGYRGDARLDTAPVTVEIEDSRMTGFSCANEDMRAFLTRCFARSNADRVGELGFGTNRSVTRPVFENSHLNERSPGVHLGFGQHNQTDAATGYSCDIHVDLIGRGGVVQFDDGGPPLDLAVFQPSDRPHPTLVNDEDIFSPDHPDEDCCGGMR